MPKNKKNFILRNISLSEQISLPSSIVSSWMKILQEVLLGSHNFAVKIKKNAERLIAKTQQVYDTNCG